MENRLKSNKEMQDMKQLANFNDQIQQLESKLWQTECERNALQKSILKMEDELVQAREKEDELLA
jgi:seryl-tRNA synthetase